MNELREAAQQDGHDDDSQNDHDDDPFAVALLIALSLQ
jgi:hypothetical protein